jgi:hypothetical protein
MSRWFTEDIGLSLAAVLLVGGLARALITHAMPPLLAAASLSLLYLGALAAGAFVAPQIRSRLLVELSKIRLGYARPQI